MPGLTEAPHPSEARGTQDSARMGERRPLVHYREAPSGNKASVLGAEVRDVTVLRSRCECLDPATPEDVILCELRRSSVCIN